MKVLTNEQALGLRESLAAIVAMGDTLNENTIEVVKKNYIEYFKASKEIGDAEEMLFQELIQANGSLDADELERYLREDFDSICDDYYGDNIYCNLLIDEVYDSFFTILDNVRKRFVNADVIINFELIHENAKRPVYAHPNDAGADIYAVENQVIPAHSFGNLVHTGLKMEMPDGWEMQIRPRSGMSKKTALRISNSPATIDSGYRGEVCVLFDNLGNEDYEIKVGDRIAQFVVAQSYRFSAKSVSTITDDTERGEGGFGSSGK